MLIHNTALTMRGRSPNWLLGILFPTTNILGGVLIIEKFKSWNDVRSELFTPEEIAESDLRVALMGEIIAVRKEQGISQRELGKLTGIKQPVIARIESGQSSPRIDTLVKLLAPLGKTIAVVPLKQ